MADAPVVHIGENSPEQVAYRLTRDIMIVERRVTNPGNLSGGDKLADRKFYLDLYAECLNAVKQPQMRVDHKVRGGE